MKILAIGPMQLLFFIPGLLAFGSLLYIIFNNRDETEKPIKLLPQVALYMFSLVPLGVIIGSYINYRKKQTPLGREYKFDNKARNNATYIIIISIISTIYSLYNLSN